MAKMARMSLAISEHTEQTRAFGNLAPASVWCGELVDKVGKLRAGKPRTALAGRRTDSFVSPFFRVSI